MAVVKCKNCGNEIQTVAGTDIAVCGHCGTENRTVTGGVDGAEGKAGVSPLLVRAQMFLEDGNWLKADSYAENVLNMDPTNAEAYLCKLMAELHCKKREDLMMQPMPFENRNNCQKIIRFGSEELKSEIARYNKIISDRNENNRKYGIYNNAEARMRSARTESDFRAAAAAFGSISDLNDAKDKEQQCLLRAEAIGKDTVYSSAKSKMNTDSVRVLEGALAEFVSLGNWRDSAECAELCKARIEELKLQQDRIRAERAQAAQQARIALEQTQAVAREKKAEKKKKRKKRAKIALPVTAVLIVACVVGGIISVPKIKLANAKKLIENGAYDEAYSILEEMGAQEVIADSKRERASSFIAAENYTDAYSLLEEIGDTEAIKANKYDRAMKHMEQKEYKEATELLEGLGYNDSEDKLKDCQIAVYGKKYVNAEVGKTIKIGRYNQDNDKENGREDIEWIVLEKDEGKMLIVSKYCLDCRKYNDENGTTSWGLCSLNKWLNDYFYNNAFSEKEHTRIITSSVNAVDNCYRPNLTGSQKCNIFLLSSDEVEKYLGNDGARKAVPTEKAKQKGVSVVGISADWWLRDACVGNDGKIDIVSADSGKFSNALPASDNIGIRPAMWVSYME